MYFYLKLKISFWIHFIYEIQFNNVVLFYQCVSYNLILKLQALLIWFHRVKVKFDTIRYKLDTIRYKFDTRSIQFDTNAIQFDKNFMQLGIQFPQLIDKYFSKYNIIVITLNIYFMNTLKYIFIEIKRLW